MSQWIHFLCNMSLKSNNWQLKKSEKVSLPMLSYYSGYLPPTRQVRHLIIATKLTGWQSSEFSERPTILPEQFKTKTTHDFSAVYQLSEQLMTSKVLFRFQICSNDHTAQELAQFLVDIMQLTILSDARYLVSDDYQDFWAGIAGVQLYQSNQAYQIWR